MSNELKAPQYPVTDDFIKRMEEVARGITVADHTDKAGAVKAREVRLEIKEARVNVEKIRKDLKADALKWGQLVDGEARRIRERLEPLEKHLQEQEDVVRLHEEREAKRKAEEEAARIEAERKAEEERLAAERAELEAERRKLQAEKERLEAERRAAEESRLAKEREIQRAEEARLAEERRKIEVEQAEARRKLEEAERIRREAEEAEHRRQEEAAAEERRRQAEAERQARVEASRPDWERVSSYLDRLSEVSRPAVQDADCQAFLVRIQRGIEGLKADLAKRQEVEVAL